MYFDQLHYLIALNYNPSMNIASQNLQITPSALSVSIKNLEKELNLQLIHRTNRGIVLTEQGKQVVRIAESFFQNVQRLQGVPTAEDPQLLCGEIQIYAAQGTLDTLLSGVICDFYHQYPAVHITVDTVAFLDIMTQFKQQTDPHAFAFVYATAHAQTAMKPNYTFHALTPVKLMAQIHERFPLAHNKTLSLKTLFHHPIILYHPRSAEGNDTLATLSAIAKPQKVMIEHNLSVYQTMIQQGIGIGFTVASPLLPQQPSILKNIHNVCIKDGPVIELGYVTRNDQPLSVQAEVFLSFVKNYIQSKDNMNGQSPFSAEKQEINPPLL